MFSLLMKERLYIGEVVFGTLFGIAIGPYGWVASNYASSGELTRTCMTRAGVFDPRSWSDDSNALTMEVMVCLVSHSRLIQSFISFQRIVIAIGVFAIGVELPKANTITFP